MLEVNNLKMQFGKLVAVNNLSFSLQKGEILGLLGANGAGKSTTFRIILGILKQTSGSVLYNNEVMDLSKSSEIGFLAEERALLTKYTVYTQLLFFAELKGMKKKDVEVQIDYWLDYFGMTDKKNKKIKELSKGNQQKIQLISAIIHTPKFIILDEPFSGLDPFNVNLFKKIILELQSKGCSIIFSSHRLDHVEYFCENIIVLVEGKSVLEGKISELKRNSKMNKIKVKGDIPIDKIKELNFVEKVEIGSGYKYVYIKNAEESEKLFDVVKKFRCDHFSLETPTLEEVFIEKVGKSYES